ncbi:MAG: hypothetical protein AAF991_00680, partial [Pseudomonadota bacterium]
MKLRRVRVENRYRIEALVETTWCPLEVLEGLVEFGRERGVHGDLASDMLAVLQLSPADQSELLARLGEVDDLSMTAALESESTVCLPFEP